MGSQSLMSGWLSRSPVNNRGSTSERKKSITEQGIEEYWRLKRVIEEDHLEAILPKKSLAEEYGPHDIHRTHSLPLDVEAQARALDYDHCWWSRSDLAFLNEPPVIPGETPSYKYATQYGLASFGPTEPDTKAPIPKPDTKVPIPKPDTKVSLSKPDIKGPTPKPDAKVPLSKPDIKGPTPKPDAKVPLSKSDIKIPTSSPDTKVPISKPDTKVPTSKSNTKVPNTK